MGGKVHLRFYEELNDFLPEKNRKHRFDFDVEPGGTVGEILTRLGVPAARVEIVLAGGDSVDLSHAAADGEYISFYPVFETLDVAGLLRLRGEPLRHLRFLAAGDLHGLARYLRLCGFDTLEFPFGSPEEDNFEKSDRVILFRAVTMRPPQRAPRARLVEAAKPRQQLRELLESLSLARLVVPLGRCPKCNAPLASAGGDRPPRLTCRWCGHSLGPRQQERWILLLRAALPR